MIILNVCWVYELNKYKPTFLNVELVFLFKKVGYLGVLLLTSLLNIFWFMD